MQGVKRPGRESDHHSPPSSNNVKNDAVVTPLSRRSSSCDTYTLIYIVVCSVIAGQRPRDEQYRTALIK
jgi:hypothetical protein